jgi:hypothetical protein
MPLELVEVVDVEVVDVEVVLVEVALEAAPPAPVVFVVELLLPHAASEITPIPRVKPQRNTRVERMDSSPGSERSSAADHGSW